VPVSYSAENSAKKESSPTAADKSVAASVENLLKQGGCRQCRELLDREKTRLSSTDFNYWYAKSWLKEAQFVEKAQQDLALKEEGVSFSSRSYHPFVEDMPVMLRDAMTCINLAIGDSSNRADLYGLRSEIYSQWHMDVSALTDATKAIELEPKNADHYVSRAAVWYDASGLKNSDVASCSDPQLKARLLAMTHMPEHNRCIALKKEALNDINAAMKLNPKDGYCYNFRSKVLQSMGDRWRDVLGDQTLAIELDPDNADYYHDRAYTWQWVSPPDINKALSDATRAVELEPNRATHRELRAVFLLQLKQWDALEAEYLVLDRMCDGGWYKQKKAEAKHAMGKMEDAVKIWETCKDSSSVIKAAYVCMSLGDLTRTMKLCDHALALDHGPQVQAHWLKAQALRVIGDESQALKEGEMALAMAKTAHPSDLDQAPRVVPAVTKTQIEDFCKSIKALKTGN
jgi:tetratricopeptide (TPR) repeat protein